jgi:hypothetical protein
VVSLAAIVATPLTVGACRSPAPTALPIEDAALAADPSQGPASRPQVELTWRLFETVHALDRSGEDSQSAVFELLINGGTPSRVALGRRASLGCAVGAAGEDDARRVASLECRAHGHGEYAEVRRPAPGELVVEAFGHDGASPQGEGPRTARQATTVNIPADAEIVVDRELSRIPDEVPSP